MMQLLAGEITGTQIELFEIADPESKSRSE